ncbi:MAG: N-acetyltransferase [Bacteroidales bacterium]|nr:N-acetyltransferase [Bacteroidales bacterium]
MKIRKAIFDDIISINNIYNQSISSNISTADILPTPISKRKKWFKDHVKENYPIFVAEINNEVIGWISLSPYRPGRLALKQTAEVSYLIRKDYQKIGIGTKLMNLIIEKSSQYGFKNIFAILLDRNIASIKLLENMGFEKWAFLPKVANFDGIECGQFYYGKRICD